MNIKLRPDLHHRITDKLQRGDYESVDDLVQEAIERLLVEDEQELEEVRAALLRAEQQIERGEYTDYNEQTILKLAERVKASGHSRFTSNPQLRSL